MNTLPHLRKYSDLAIGTKFHRWAITGTYFLRDRSGHPMLWYPVECECGKVSAIMANNLVNGSTKSCGCLIAQRCRERATHGMTVGGKHHPIYRRWACVMNRCNNPNASDYSYYGARGIKVCPEWHNFVVFRDWCAINGFSPSLEIDRIDNNGPYAPWNCRFVTKQVNGNNRRDNHRLTAFGESKTLAEWLRDTRCSVHRHTIKDRMKKGLTAERAISEPGSWKRRFT